MRISELHPSFVVSSVGSITYLGHEVIAIIVIEYDEQLLLPLLLEAHRVFMPHRYEDLIKFTLFMDSSFFFHRPT
jgi:hypothetical protein